MRCLLQGVSAFQTGRVQYRAFQQRASRQTCTTVCQGARAAVLAAVAAADGPSSLWQCIPLSVGFWVLLGIQAVCLGWQSAAGGRYLQEEQQQNAYVAPADVFDCAKHTGSAASVTTLITLISSVGCVSSAADLHTARLVLTIHTATSFLCCLSFPSSCLCATAAAVADAAAPVKGDLMNVSYYPSGADAANVTKRWYIIDAKGQTLGRLATLAATYIRCEPGRCHWVGLLMGLGWTSRQPQQALHSKPSTAVAGEAACVQLGASGGSSAGGQWRGPVWGSSTFSSDTKTTVAAG